MSISVIPAGVIFLFLLVSGCASVQSDQEWARFNADIQERTGHELLWEKSEIEEAAIRKEVDTLLSEGLTRPEALSIALLNNRSLQSTFEEIGIAKSDLIQAGLFHNPSLSLFFRFPFSGSGTNTEADGKMSLSDFWQIPFRKKVAAAHLEKVMMRAAQAVLDTDRDAKQAYDSVYYLNLAKQDAEEIFNKFKEIAGEVEKRREFGFLSDLEVSLARVMETNAQMALHQVHSEYSIAKARLDRVLGLAQDRTGYRVSGKSIDLPPIPNREKAVEYAEKHRFDVQMAQFSIVEAERKLRLEKALVFKEVGLGASYERDIDGYEVLGPGFDIQLPIFHQNQAGIAKANYLLRKVRKRLQVLKGQIREEIAHDLSRIELHTERLHLLREKILPLRQHALAYSRKWVHAMQLNRLYLLEAQKGLLEGQLEIQRTLLARNHAIADLERHVGGKFPVLESPR